MPSPFFVVGSGRCGATWLYTVIREHPRIAMTNEARVLDFLYFSNELVNLPDNQPGRCVPQEGVEIRGMVRDAYRETLSTIYIAKCKEICEDFYRAYFADRQYDWWGDKLPDPRVALGARRLWPDARYLVLVRDPRDVLCSWRAYAKRPEVRAQHPELVDYPADTLASSWSAIYRGLPRELEDPMILRYEDLCADPRRHVEGFLRSLDLEWSADVERALEENDTFKGHGTASSLEASMGRWQNELPAEDVALVERVCGDVMTEFGYPLHD